MNEPAQAQRGAVPLQGVPETATELAVSVVLRITPTPEHRWIDERVETLAVVPAAAQDSQAVAAGDDSTANSEGARIVRHDGLTIELFPDEAESYYSNLMVDDPRCFVVFRAEDEDDEDANYEPFVVTASADLATAYEEGDHKIDAVPLDPALLQTIEAFILMHYVPQKRIKRKRRDWKKS